MVFLGNVSPTINKFFLLFFFFLYHRFTLPELPFVVTNLLDHVGEAIPQSRSRQRQNLLLRHIMENGRQLVDECPIPFPTITLPQVETALQLSKGDEECVVESLFLVLWSLHMSRSRRQCNRRIVAIDGNTKLLDEFRRMTVIAARQERTHHLGYTHHLIYPHLHGRVRTNTIRLHFHLQDSSIITIIIDITTIILFQFFLKL